MFITTARLLLTGALAWVAVSPSSGQDDASLRRQGRALLASRCSHCHAITLAGDSPDREAPPFRTLGQKYPIEWLAEALAEGLFTGHPNMPEFVFAPQEINAILAYLQSIQVPEAGSPKGR